MSENKKLKAKHEKIKLKMLRDCRVLITGGAGFIGSHLVERLFQNNKILVIDNLYRGSNLDILSKKYRNFSEKVQLLKNDVRNKETMRSALKTFEPTHAFHLASMAGVGTVINSPADTMEINIIGSHNLMNALTGIRGLEKVIYTSSSEVYGPLAMDANEEGYTTQGSPYDPRWSYAASKLCVEHLLIGYERQYGIPVVVCRPFNIYGPRQIGEGAIHNFIANALAGKPLKIYGDGGQIRAWCYVSDCVDGLLLLAGKGKGVYNIGNPSGALTVYSLALLITEMTGSSSKIVFEKEMTYTDIRLRIPLIKKIRALGFEPKISLREGLAKTIQWYKSGEDFH